MASSSRLCSDEELQKAMDDLKEILARSPIPDEFMPRDGKGEEKKENKVEKKKKMYVLPKERVEMLLNYQCRPIHETEAINANINKLTQECRSIHETEAINANINKLTQEDEDSYGDLRTLSRVATVLTKNYHDIIHAAQEELRQEVETKGYFAYEATDDEEDDNVGVAVRFEQPGPRGKGHRRHRPGIVKQAGGVKKLN